MVIKIFKKISFKTETQTNLKVTDFLDITFNLSNSTYFLYVDTSSSYPPEILKQLPTSTAKRYSKNSSSVEIFNSWKVEYENPLKNSGYHSINLNYTQTREIKPKHNRSWNIIFFNPPHIQNIITNVAKHFLNLLNHHFQKFSTEIQWKLATLVEKTSPAWYQFTQHYKVTQL